MTVAVKHRIVQVGIHVIQYQSGAYCIIFAENTNMYIISIIIIGDLRTYTAICMLTYTSRLLVAIFQCKTSHTISL